MLRYLKLLPAAATVVTGVALAAPAAPAEMGTGTFALVSDIHFDPFDPEGLAETLAATDAEHWMARFAALPPGPASQYGKDTNHVLFSSALAALTRTAANADFAIVTGDLLSHGFEDATVKALGVPLGSQAQRVFAQRTTIFVAEAIAGALAGKPVIIALGNNDSDCGDYEIEPGGGYLAATRDTARRLVGADLVAADFDATYAAGGYYAARHPTVPNTLILVVNDVLWSERYQNACGKDGLAGGRQQMDWLRATLAAQKAAGGRVWMAHHIPWGIDPYSTEHSKADSCPAKVVPFMKDEFSAAFVDLIREYAGIIDTSFSGHVHFDDYRLLLDDAGKPVEIDKVVPAISPIFGQNPGFQMFSYDLATGQPKDFTTIYLANLPELSPVNGDWREAYVFSKTYGLPGYSVESVAALWNGLGQGGQIRDAYLDHYNVGHGTLAETDLKGYACAVAFLDPQ
ncbi:MAG TPA: metallophosphoesterase, partial [Bauldia sp.]|nr:metallophosphoesterase [Bauldia sp.]